MIFLPAAIASSRISLYRCESSLGSEQSIEENSLPREVTPYIKVDIFYKEKKALAHHNALLPVHVTLALLVQVNQILLLRFRSPIVRLKLLNIRFSDLLSYNIKLHNLKTSRVQGLKKYHKLNMKQVPSCTLF